MAGEWHIERMDDGFLDNPQNIGRDGQRIARGGPREGRGHRRDSERDLDAHDGGDRDAPRVRNDKGKGGKDRGKGRRGDAEGRSRVREGHDREQQHEGNGRDRRRRAAGDPLPDGGGRRQMPNNDELALAEFNNASTGIIERYEHGVIMQYPGYQVDHGLSLVAIITRELMALRQAEYQGPPDQEAPTRILQKLYTALNSQEHATSPNELADLVYVLGKLYVGKTFELNDVVESILIEIADKAKLRVEELSPVGLSNIAGGFANFSSPNAHCGSLMSLMAAEVVVKIHGFEHRHLSQTAWAFAKCSLWNGLLANTLADESKKKMATFTAQSLSQLSWAMAQWMTNDRGLTDALVDTVTRKAVEMPPGPLATISLSFLNLKVTDSAAFKSIADAVMIKSADFKPQDLANVVWAFSRLTAHDGLKMFDAMPAQIQDSIARCLGPGDRCDVALAFSQIRSTSNQPLLLSIANEALHQLEKFGSSEIVDLMWSFASAQIQHKPLFTEVGNMVAKSMHKFGPQQLASLARTYGASRSKHRDFLAALADHVRRCLSGPPSESQVFKAPHLANIAFAFAMVSVYSEDLMRLMAPTIVENITELKPMFLARCANAYRVLSVRCPGLMATVVGESLRKLPDFSTRDLRRVIDSRYISMAPGRSDELERELARRLAKFGSGLLEICSPARASPLPGDQYRILIDSNRDLGCSLAGAGPVSASIDIGMPSRDFMRRCFDQVRKSSESPTSFLADHVREYTAAEINLSLIGRQDRRPHHEWFIRYEGHGQNVPLRSEFLQAVDVGRRSWCDCCSVSMFLVLHDICHRVASMGVAMESAEGRASLGGRVDILCTLLPDLSSLGALRQFDSLFPNVTVTFVEQVVRTTMATEV